MRDYARVVFDHAQLGMAVLDGTGTFTQTNQALRTLFGFTPDDLIGQSLEAVVDAEYRATVVTALDGLLTMGTSAKVDLRFSSTTRGPRWVRTHLSREPADDRRTAIIGTFEDVTDEKQAAEAAHSRTRRLEQLLEGSNDIIFNIGLDGRFTWVNPVASRLMKRPLDELVGLSFLELVRPDYRLKANSFYEHQIAHHVPSTYYEFPVVSTDGAEIWLGQNVQLILERGQVINIQAVARDITARKHTEDLLRASEDRLRAVVSNAPIILWAADREGRFTLCEGHGLKRLGVEPGDAAGRYVGALYNDPRIAGHLQRALAGDTFQIELTLGGPVFDSWYSPLRDADGNITGVIGVAVDITQRVRLSGRLLEAEKMEAIGRLAAGVAHDFNNQLTAILGFAQMLQGSLGDDDPRSADVEQILKGGRRVGSLTEQLLAFGRNQPRRPTVLDLNAVVAELEPLLVLTVREDVRLETQLAPDLCAVTADELQIEQVIMNLVLNARDAMPTGGQLTIRTANVSLDEAHTVDHPELVAGCYVVLEVADNGDGMDAETKAHIFEPFYTTKEQGKGTGMGLASVYGISRQSGGVIEVASELGHGSTFTVYLPSAGDAVPATVSDPIETMAQGSDDTCELSMTRRSLR
jgi:two-component system, cell cycle sensor histidine kinase and response regulator CckA